MCHQSPKHYIEIWHERPFSLQRRSRLRPESSRRTWERERAVAAGGAPRMPCPGLCRRVPAVCTEARWPCERQGRGNSARSRGEGVVAARLTVEPLLRPSSVPTEPRNGSSSPPRSSSADPHPLSLARAPPPCSENGLSCHISI